MTCMMLSREGDSMTNESEWKDWVVLEDKDGNEGEATVKESKAVKIGLKRGFIAVSILWCGEQLSRSAPSAWAISKGF